MLPLVSFSSFENLPNLSFAITCPETAAAFRELFQFLFPLISNDALKKKLIILCWCKVARICEITYIKPIINTAFCQKNID